MLINRSNYSNKQSFGATANIVIPAYHFPDASITMVYDALNRAIYPPVVRILQEAKMPVTERLAMRFIDTDTLVDGINRQHHNIRQVAKKPDLIYFLQYQNKRNDKIDLNICQFYGNLVRLADVVGRFFTGK